MQLFVHMILSNEVALFEILGIYPIVILGIWGGQSYSDLID